MRSWPSSLHPLPERLIHAMIRIGDSALMLVDEGPEWGSLGPEELKGSSVTTPRHVEAVDTVLKQAVEAVVKITMPPAEMFRG